MKGDGGRRGDDKGKGWKCDDLGIGVKDRGLRRDRVKGRLGRCNQRG